MIVENYVIDVKKKTSETLPLMEEGVLRTNGSYPSSCFRLDSTLAYTSPNSDWHINKQSDRPQTELPFYDALVHSQYQSLLQKRDYMQHIFVIHVNDCICQCRRSRPAIGNYLQCRILQYHRLLYIHCDAMCCSSSRVDPWSAVFYDRNMAGPAELLYHHLYHHF